METSAAGTKKRALGHRKRHDQGHGGMQIGCGLCRCGGCTSPIKEAARAISRHRRASRSCSWPCRRADIGLSPAGTKRHRAAVVVPVSKRTADTKHTAFAPDAVVLGNQDAGTLAGKP